MVLGGEPAEPLPPIALTETAKRLFVTIYVDGDARGCMGSEIGDLENDLRTLTKSALSDERFEHPEIDEDTSVAVSVSLLPNELEMADFSPEEVPGQYRPAPPRLI